MNWQLFFPPDELADRNPELFFDDQPVESLIYHMETIEEPSPADIITWQNQKFPLKNTFKFSNS